VAGTEASAPWKDPTAVRRGLLYPRMLNHCVDLDWDIQKLGAENTFVFEDLTMNAITIRGLVSIANLNEALGEKEKAKTFRDQAQAMTETIDRINWDEPAGCYWSRWDLKNPKQFWLPYVLCFNAKDELDQEKIALENLMLWRGYCIWTNMNWMMTEGLLNYGYRDEARELTRRSAKMIRNQGFREFYDCRTGQAGGATRFNWPAVVLDMIAMTWPEAIEGA